MYVKQLVTVLYNTHDVTTLIISGNNRMEGPSRTRPACICQGCHNKAPWIGDLNYENPFSHSSRG